MARLTQRDAQVERRRGLRDATLLIRERDDARRGALRRGRRALPLDRGRRDRHNLRRLRLVGRLAHHGRLHDGLLLERHLGCGVVHGLDRGLGSA